MEWLSSLARTHLYSTLAFAEEARRAREAGIRVLDLTVGEPLHRPPERLLEDASRSVGLSGYSPSRGLPELRRAIAKLEAMRFNADVAPDEVLVTPGSKPALYIAMMLLCNPGDTVVVVDPAYYAYPNMAVMLGLRVSYVKMSVGDRFDLNPSAVEEAIESAQSRVCAIYLNTPQNPTGAVFSPKSVDEVLSIASSRGVPVVSDEVYADFVFEGEHRSILSHSDWRDLGIYINSFSKSYAVPGWRVGYMIARREVVDAAARLAANMHTCAPTPLQAALVSAPELLEEVRETIRRVYTPNVKLANEVLPRIPGVKHSRVEGAFYAFPSIGEVLREAGITVEEYARRLLYEEGVAVTPGTVFPRDLGRERVRISLAVETDSLREALERIRALHERLLEGATT